jgi:hypothetical protein
MVESITKFAWATSTIGSFQKVLESWKPADPDGRRSQPKTEKTWERSLVEHLRLMLTDVNIIPQGGTGMKMPDIVIERKGYLGGIKRDIVELKLGLSSTGIYQRLVGQIHEYLKEDGTTLVVICGDDVDPKLIKSLEGHYPSDQERLAIFWKKSSKRGVTQLFPKSSGIFG